MQYLVASSMLPKVLAGLNCVGVLACALEDANVAHIDHDSSHHVCRVCWLTGDPSMCVGLRSGREDSGENRNESEERGDKVSQ